MSHASPWAKFIQAIQSLAVVSILLGMETATECAFANNETNMPAAKLEIQASTDVQAKSISEEFDFAILKRIDDAPAFGLGAGRNNVATKGSSKARSLVNFMFDTRGSDWSKEGADVAVDKKSEVSSETTLFYQDQIHRDDLHWQVVSLIARIASAIGSDSKSDSSDNAIQGVSQLQQLVGDTETDCVMKWLTWRDTDNLRGKIPKTARFDLPRILDTQDSMSKTALEKDSVIASIKRELLPYGNKGKGRRVATKMVYSVLGTAAFIPNWIAPVAETSFLTTMMANGGPEQDKLLKELYYAKRLEKRHDLIQKELNLALNSREISVATGNAALYHFSRELTEYLCGEDMEQRLFPEEASSVSKEQDAIR